MSKLTRFFGTCLLTASISAVAFADGGSVQGPPAPPPPTGQCVADSTDLDASTQPQESSVDVATAVDMLANWLALAIL
ncbi:MAG: hypothetical protein QOG23_310 [Blastocatellia bacterium]|jgi:hypothetical protein|nr:hypothetical protein [Blastocatellia bacterium]